MRPLHLLVLVHDVGPREVLLELLRSGGYHAVTAPDSVAAAEAIGAAGFDGLVLGLNWPELDRARLQEALVPDRAAEPEPLDGAERRHIALTLRYTGGNKRRAAQILGISRSTLLHKVRKYGLGDWGLSSRS